MKNKILKVLKSLGIGLIGFLIIAVLFVWLSGETEIGDIKIENGQGTFEHEAITVDVDVSEFVDGEITISENSKFETKHLLEAAYTSEYSYRLSGSPALFNGKIEVTFPLDEALLSRYSIDDLKKGLYIVSEEPSLQKDGDESVSPTLYPVTINEENKTISTVIAYETLDAALGGYYETKPTPFSFFKTAFAQNNSDEPTMSINVSARYFPELEQVKSKHFVLHDINKNMPIERYKTLLNEMEGFFTTIRSLGLNTDEIDFPINVYLDDDLVTGASVQYGEMDMFLSTRRRANLNLNKKILTKTNMTPEEVKEMKMTAGHELFHIIQQNYWRRGHSVLSVESFNWIDEATAVTFEMLLDKNTTPSVMDENTNTLWNSSISNYNDFESDFYKRRSYGYGLSYMMQYLVKTHPKGKRIVGDLYQSIAKGEAPKTAFNKTLVGAGGAKQFWLNFINKEMTQQSSIHTKASMNKNVNIFFGKGKNEAIVYSKGRLDRKSLLKNTTENSITLEANLPNLSADVVLLQLSAGDETIKKLMKTLGRKYTISVSGDEGTGAMVYHIPYGQKSKNARLKSSSFTNNLIQPGQSIELTDLMRTSIVLVNYDGNVANPIKRKVTVTIKFSAGESFEDLEAPPVRDKIDEKALRELEKWYQFCKKQAEPQQQSNKMLMDYYKNKANEIQKAIALLKNGTNIYDELDLAIKPDDPKSLIRKVERSIRNIESKQDYAFNSMVKLDEALSNPTPEVEADKALYQLSIDFFDYRQVAYGHLLDYLKAVEDSGNVANNSSNDKYKTKETFHLGTWIGSPSSLSQLNNTTATIKLTTSGASVNIKTPDFSINQTNIPYDKLDFYEDTYWEDLTMTSDIVIKNSNGSDSYIITLQTFEINDKGYFDIKYFPNYKNVRDSKYNFNMNLDKR